MQILIGCAKDMGGEQQNSLPLTRPRFQADAEHHALQLTAYSPEELRQMLKVSPQIAGEVWQRYQAFLGDEGLRPAIQAYTGVVYKHLGAQNFDSEDYSYAQHHLWITSFLYGLLRPLDAIKPYRLEGKVVLPQNGISMFAYWKPRLTDCLIDAIQADDGILVDLASHEMRSFFDWKRVEREVTVVKPDFLVSKGGVVKNVTVYAKMCRGAMTGYILKQRLSSPDDIKQFTFDGFAYHGDGKDERNPVFIQQQNS